MIITWKLKRITIRNKGCVGKGKMFKVRNELKKVSFGVKHRLSSELISSVSLMFFLILSALVSKVIRKNRKNHYLFLLKNLTSLTQINTLAWISTSITRGLWVGEIDEHAKLNITNSLIEGLQVQSPAPIVCIFSIEHIV